MSSNKPQKPLLEGLVAQILNARELVINIGSLKGVQPKMKFAILAPKVLEIRDPVSGDILDLLDREKVRVIASEVRDQISICRTYRVHIIPGGALYNNPNINVLSDLRDAFKPPKEVPETLSANNAMLPPPLSPEESYIQIGDRVIQISEE